jgi:flagellar motor switch protein FliG
MEFMGPVKLRLVEESQQKIVAAIRRLEENGEVQIGRGEEDVLV